MRLTLAQRYRAFQALCNKSVLIIGWVVTTELVLSEFLETKWSATWPKVEKITTDIGTQLQSKAADVDMQLPWWTSYSVQQENNIVVVGKDITGQEYEFNPTTKHITKEATSALNLIKVKDILKKLLRHRCFKAIRNRNILETSGRLYYIIHFNSGLVFSGWIWEIWCVLIKPYNSPWATADSANIEQNHQQYD